MVTTKKKPQKTSNSGKNVEKLEALHTADGIVKWCKLPLKKMAWKFSKKANKTTNSIPTSEYISKRTESRPIYISMFYSHAALSTIAKRQKQAECPLTDE